MSRSISPPNTSGSIHFAQRTTPTRHRHLNSTHPTQTSDKTSQHSSLAPNPFEDPFVKKLYAKVQDEVYVQAYGGDQKLKLENEILQAEVACFSLSAGTSCAQLLSPSDLISQVPTLSHISFAPSVAIHPSKRPSEYPFKVLWTVDDCHNNPDASPPNSNPSHPPMNLAIRTSDSALISAEKYNNIRTDISLLANANLHQLPTPINNPTRHCKSIRIADVLHQLEIMHNELQLCSGHWKAEHMLMQHLNSYSMPSGPDINLKSPIANKQPRSDSMSATASATKRLRLEDTDKMDIYLEDLNLLQDTFGLTIVLSSVQPSPSQPPSQPQPPSQFYHYLHFSCNIFLQEFPSMKAAPLLIDHLTKIATTKKNPRKPSSEVTMFISHIEDADPNSPELTEDDTNAGWGHHQFTAGSLTILTVLVLWDAIGSVSTACKLILAAIKTCWVAQYMCNKQGINSESYMSDAYLNRIIDKLTDLTANHSSETQVTAQPEASTTVHLVEVVFHPL
ncbi:hypothetical protein BDZ94DRAFT_1371140, partial [Collybia nuda]